MMGHTRLRLDMSMFDAVQVMSNGNPGALTVMSTLLRDGAAIDPDDGFRGFGAVMALDTLGIYGDEVWCLFKDVCGQKLHNVIAVLRAWQLGQLEGCTREAIKAAIASEGREALDCEKIVAAVKNRLPQFTVPA